MNIKDYVRCAWCFRGVLKKHALYFGGIPCCCQGCLNSYINKFGGK